MVRDWSLTHSFYVNMGGFAFESCRDGRDQKEFFPPGETDTRFTLTSNAVQFLLENEPEVIPTISREQILDKSKASGLAKTLTCLQATWFCLSCIARLASRLPICLLELNTFGHAIFALLMYAAWWEKPLDIEQPTLFPLEGVKTRSVFADMYRKSKAGRYWRCMAVFMYSNGQLSPPVSAKIPVEETLEKIVLGIPPAQDQGKQPAEVSPKEVALVEPGNNASPLERFNSETAKSSTREEAEKVSTNVDVGESPTKPHEITLSRNQVAQYFHNLVVTDNCRPCKGTSWKGMIKRDSGGRVYRIHFDSETLRFRRMCYEVSELASPERTHTTVPKPTGYEFFTIRQRNRTLFLKDNQFLTFCLGLTVAGLVYGGMHVFGWNLTRASPAEQTLWKISVITICAAPLVPFVFWVAVTLGYSMVNIVEAWDNRRRLEDIYMDDDDDDIEGCGPSPTVCCAWLMVMLGSMLSGWIVIAFGVFYLVCRTYIVVESFIDLFRLPDAAFDVPRWTTYFPHIS